MHRCAAMRRGPDNLCFKGSGPILGNGRFPARGGSTVNQEVFFTWWCLGVSWVFWNFFYGSYMANFFRVKCDFGEATHVRCMRESEEVVMSNTNRFVLWSRALSKKFGSGVSFYEVTVPVQTKDSIRSFEFQCVQYVYNSRSGSFEVPEFPVPTSYPALRSSSGLDRMEHASRLSQLGPNAIPYTVSSWLQLIGEEFSTYLYVYQFTFFSVWLWFSALVRHRQPAMPND